MTEPGPVTRGRAPRAFALPVLSGASTLPSMLFAELEEAIITGALEPGGRIHADDLAAHYGVSRIPVREALRSLHEAGWVDIKPRYGVRIRERSETELTELFELRALIEAQVSRWAAERRTSADLTAIERAVRDGEKAQRGGRPAALRASSSEFYRVLTAAAHNSVLDGIAVTLRKRARFYFATVEDQLGRDWVEVHKDLLAAVRASDPERAGGVAGAHIVRTGAAVRSLLF